MLAALLTMSCGGKKVITVHGMGERVELGRIIYSVLEAEWRDRLGEGATARLPSHQYLLIRVSVTNGSTRDFYVPQLTLVSPGGQEYQELSEFQAEEVPDWFGVLRKLTPAETEARWIVFDAPRGDYRLRVADDELDPAEAKTALIEIPVRLVSVPTGSSLEKQMR